MKNKKNKTYIVTSVVEGSVMDTTEYKGKDALERAKQAVIELALEQCDETREEITAEVEQFLEWKLEKHGNTSVSITEKN